MKLGIVWLIAMMPILLLGQNCLFDEIHKEHIFLTTSNNEDIELREKVVIPVVVHIVWNKEIENISDIQVQSQLEILNENFQRTSADLPFLAPNLKELMGTPNFEFCLTGIDEDGNPTTGITRTQTNIENIGHSKNIFHDIEGGKNAWDTERFLNIWVCGLDRTLLGYASAPTNINILEDGVVLNYRYFGRVGTATYAEPYHLGKTLTHEIGHYFNLLHPWGMIQGECEEDDLVADTPIQDRAFYGCSLDGEESCGIQAQLKNFMGNADDECLTFFTKGQVERMTNALHQLRPLLLENANCVEIDFSENINLLVFPNPASTSFSILLTGNIASLNFELRNTLGLKLSAGVVKVNEIESYQMGDDLADGLYLLSFFDGEHEWVATQKVVKSAVH